jgi:hypothetical protein
MERPVALLNVDGDKVEAAPQASGLDRNLNSVLGCEQFELPFEDEKRHN